MRSNITIEFMFEGINMVWARLRLIDSNESETLPDKVIIVDLFRFSIVCSQYRSCDDTLEV